MSTLLGFDARVLDRDDVLWTQERREQYLLRTDVRKPLSVGTLTWPSLFDTGEGRGMPEAQRRRMGWAGIQPPAWIGPHAGLWSSVEQLLDVLDKNSGAIATDYVVIALSVGRCHDSALDDAAGPPHVGAKEFEVPSGGWRLLGWDVADSWLLSGLTACGYTHDDLDELRSLWSPRLNDYHLFTEESRALEFVRVTNDRVPQHAPFHAYGVYLIGESPPPSGLQSST